MNDIRPLDVMENYQKLEKIGEGMNSLKNPTASQTHYTAY